MLKTRLTIVAAAALMAVGSSAGAQMRVAGSFPAGAVPPAGMCRVWLAGVDVSRQPAPTDCARARAIAPANSRILHGPTRNGLRTNGPWWEARPDGQDTRQTNGSTVCRDSNRDGICDYRQDGRNDRVDNRSDKERRKWEKERRKEERKRDREWNKARAQDRDRDDDDDDDDDRNRNRDRARREQNGPWYERGRNGTAGCADRNRDGICDSTQRTSRVGFP